MSSVLESMDSIQRFIGDRERSKTLQFQRQIEEVERKLKEINVYYMNLIQRLESKGHNIHKLVERLTEGYVNICSLMQKEQVKTIQQHKNTLLKEFKKFRSGFQKYRSTVTSSSCTCMTEIEQQILDLDVEVPPLPKQIKFSYVENTEPLDDVRSAFGILSSGQSADKSTRKQDQVSTGQVIKHQQGYEKNHADRIGASIQTVGNVEVPAESIPCSDTREIHDQDTQEGGKSCLLDSTDNQSHRSVSSQETNTIQYNIATVSHFKHSNAFTSLCATVDGAWIAFDREKKVSLVDLNGDITKSLVARDCVEDIGISHTTARLWIACSDNSVTEYHDTVITGVVFSVPTRPKCICLTPNDHVVVGCYGDKIKSHGSISLYDVNGDRINKTQGPLVKPLHMASHNLHTQIAVVHGGNDGCHRVTVYNDQLELNFTFRGLTRKQFQPGGMCFHGDGNLFVCDLSSSSIAVLNSLGHCLSTVPLASPSKPLSLSIDANVIWVGHHDNTVKVSQIT